MHQAKEAYAPLNAIWQDQIHPHPGETQGSRWSTPGAPSGLPSTPTSRQSMNISSIYQSPLGPGERDSSPRMWHSTR